MKLHFHKYSKWSDPINTYDSGHKQQRRVCEVCNKAQFRAMRWDKQSALVIILESIKGLGK